MNQAVKLVAAIAMSCLALAVPASALDDTPENRATQADAMVPLQSELARAMAVTQEQMKPK